MRSLALPSAAPDPAKSCAAVGLSLFLSMYPPRTSAHDRSATVGRRAQYLPERTAVTSAIRGERPFAMRPLAHKFRREKVEISAAVARGRQSLLWSKLGARLERPELAASASSLFTEADTRSSSGEHTSGDFRMTGKAEEEAFMLTSLTVSSWPSTAHRAMDVMLTQRTFRLTVGTALRRPKTRTAPSCPPLSLLHSYVTSICC